MFKNDRVILRFLSVTIIIIIFFSQTSFVVGQPLEEIHKKLTGITEEEKEVVEKLFVLVQEIEDIERDEERLIEEMESIGKEVGKLEIQIGQEEDIYGKKKEALKQVLKSYQRMGPGSYIEIILNSNSLAMLLRSINTLQDITRNTGELLSTIEKSKDKLLLAKKDLDDKYILAEEKRKQLEETLSNKIRHKQEIEKYLASLEGEKEYYQEYLSILQKAWNQIGGTLSNTIKELSRIISEEELPADAMDLTFSFLKVKGTIKENVFNDIVKKYPILPEIIFSFVPDKIILELPDSNIVLEGKLIVIDGTFLELVVEEGSFYGMPLESRTIEELLKENRLLINLKPQLYGNKLDYVEIKQGYIELVSTLKLF